MKQALYTDPDDQSAWIYHRWLVGQSKCNRALTLQSGVVFMLRWPTLYLPGGDDIVEREIVNIKELLELESESKCM